MMAKTGSRILGDLYWQGSCDKATRLLLLTVAVLQTLISFCWITLVLATKLPGQPHAHAGISWHLLQLEATDQHQSEGGAGRAQ
jgi:hypothetical protein